MQLIKLAFSYKFQWLLSLVLVLSFFSSIVCAAAAPEVELLKSFGKQEGNPDGKLIQDADGNLYGTTTYGGDFGRGTLYKIDASGIHSTLFSFDVGDYQKDPSFLGRDSKLYGFGFRILDTDPFQKDTIFQFDPSQPAQAFNTVQDIDAPVIASTQDSDGKIQGVTWNSITKKGTKFQLDTAGATPVYSVLNTFTGSPDFGPDPVSQTSFILGKNGMFYKFVSEAFSSGTNEAPSNAGRLRIYQIDISESTSASTLLLTYTQLGRDQSVYSVIQGSNGKFYGIVGPSTDDPIGHLFQFDISGGTPVYTVVHKFPRNINPDLLIQGSDDKLYGTTIGSGSDSAGTIYQFDLSGATSKYNDLYEFPGSITPIRGLIQGRDGKLYGTTFAGGKGGTGTVFQLDLSGATPSYSLLHEFPASNTELPVVQGSDGKFYGSTFTYINGFNQMFQLEFSKSTPASAIQPIFDLFVKQELISLVKGKDGKYYGGTLNGGVNNRGTLFQLDTSRATPIYTVLHKYIAPTTDSDRVSSPTSLIQANDGKLYGTTNSTISSSGTLFRLDISGTTPIYEVLHGRDPGTNNGTSATYLYDLTQGNGSDSKFYGITAGANGWAVFEFDTTGTTSAYKFLHEFGVNNGDGFTPNSLTLANDGKLYGTAFTGNDSSLPYTGVVFQIDTSGMLPTYTVVQSFAGLGVGAPYNLIQGGDGKLYGLIAPSFRPGNFIFQLDISVAPPINTVYELKDNSGRQVSINGLIQGSDGSFYGYAGGGGQYGRGGIYQIRLPKTNIPPVATNDSFALTIPRRNASVTVAAPGVLGNDKDAEGKALTVVGAKGATPKVIEFSEGGGAVALYADGHFTYTPGKKCFYGTRSFTYEVTDGQDTSNPATVTLTTKRRNHEHHGHKRQP